MYTTKRVLGLGLLLPASIVLCLAGCESTEEEAPPGASAESEVGRPLNDIELPVSLRTTDPAPSGAAAVEATIEQLRVGGEPVLALDDGKVPDADRTAEGIIPKLEQKLRSPVRSSLALRLQANIPYDTLALVLNTAKRAGIHNVGFQVRKAGASSETGWMTINGFVTSSKADELPAIPGVEYKSWNAFTDNWQPIFDGCRTARSGNCAYVNENVAMGGTLRMELMASGRGININFFRRGLTTAQEAEEEQKQAAQMAAKKEDFLQGRITKDDMVEALLLGHPSTYALFQFRYQEALTAPSALTKTMAPMCQGEKCGLIVTADKITHFVRIATMLGAAFPDGTKLPSLSFELPWTEKPKPADLQAFIEAQQAKEG